QPRPSTRPAPAAAAVDRVAARPGPAAGVAVGGRRRPRRPRRARDAACAPGAAGGADRRAPPALRRLLARDALAHAAAPDGADAGRARGRPDAGGGRAAVDRPARADPDRRRAREPRRRPPLPAAAAVRARRRGAARRRPRRHPRAVRRRRRHAGRPARPLGRSCDADPPRLSDTGVMTGTLALFAMAGAACCPSQAQLAAMVLSKDAFGPGASGLVLARDSGVDSNAAAARNAGGGVTA